MRAFSPLPPPTYGFPVQLAGVQGRDWRLFRKNLISKYGQGDSRAAWGEGCWAHEIGEVEPVSFYAVRMRVRSVLSVVGACRRCI